MPEYLAPGVYIEEKSFRSKSIEGVSTTTTGFIGPTRFGPTDVEPDIVTSMNEFERTYGNGDQLTFGSVTMDNFMWHAARAFFTEGGKRLYVSRVFRPLDNAAATAANLALDGRASVSVGGVTFSARYPGAFGNFRIRVTAKSGANVLGRVTKPGTTKWKPTVGSVTEFDVVWVRTQGAAAAPSIPSSIPPDNGDFYLVQRDDITSAEVQADIQQRVTAGDVTSADVADLDTSEKPLPWRLSSVSPVAGPLDGRPLSALVPNLAAGQGDSVRVVTLTIELLDSLGLPVATWSGLPLDPSHSTNGLADGLTVYFGRSEEASERQIIVDAQPDVSGLDVLLALFSADDLANGDTLTRGVTRNPDLVLSGGNDGQRPGAAEYEGQDDPDQQHKTGLKQFEAIDDISIVAAPGTTWNYVDPYRDEANAITGLLLAHAENMRYRIAVLDSAQNQTISDVRKMRAKLDSKYGALYFPWVRIFDPITRKVISLPPSGFVSGIYARNDIERAVYKAPANEVVRLSIGFDMLLSKAQQDVLNPEGINCFRFFEGRGMLLWGARTVSSDPEWKYVNLRRYFAYLEHSIDRGTQWAVFEPNGERLWANVRRTIEDFLLNEWQMGALLGDKPEKAYFVKCDRTTMTQNDLDNGRLVCLIGVVVVKPAEFVIFRIGQWTADSKV